jgi:RNA polymerase-binding transcription factor DksA
MDAAEKLSYAELLAARKRELARRVGDRLHQHGLDHHEYAALPRRSEDTDDDATASSMRDADVSSLARAARDLALIDAACERLLDGTYGECVDCADPIPAARLLANPAAARCASCQETLERRPQPA